jgi:CSLREA domain-containing protein
VNTAPSFEGDMTVPTTTFPHRAPSLPAARRALAAALLVALAPAVANAATIVVTSRDDTNPAATNTCTLRQAIVSMNTGVLNGNCTVSDGENFGVHDTITFAASALATAATPGRSRSPIPRTPAATSAARCSSPTTG